MNKIKHKQQEAWKNIGNIVLRGKKISLIHLTSQVSRHACEKTTNVLFVTSPTMIVKDSLLTGTSVTDGLDLVPEHTTIEET